LRAKTLFLVSLLATLTPEVSKKPLSKCTWALRWLTLTTRMFNLRHWTQLRSVKLL
jgi:hypothetical protein